MIPDNLYRACLAPLGIVSAKLVAPGNSGAQVYRCADRLQRQFALKRWPRGVDPKRVDEVHQVMQQARSSGCLLVPEVIRLPNAIGRSCSVVCEGDCWDLVAWIPGAPIGSDASLNDIRNGALAIYQFHGQAKEQGRRMQIAPAITERLQRLRQLDQRIGSFAQLSRTSTLPPPLKAATDQAASLLDTKWNEAHQQIIRSLSKYEHHPVMNQIVLRDVHRQHILFADTQPTGLIDFDAVRFDTPAVDLARWVGSCWIDPANHRLRDVDTLLATVLAGISAECSLLDRYYDEHEIALSRAFAYANPWISLANWLVWLLVEQRSFPAGCSNVAHRVLELTNAASQAKWVE